MLPLYHIVHFTTLYYNANTRMHTHTRIRTAHMILYNSSSSYCDLVTHHIHFAKYFTGYAFHVDVATAYKIIRDTFSEREVCELTEIQLYPPQHMVSIVQKGSPLRKMITYG